MIAVALGGRAYALEVGAGARLGHRDRGRGLARDHPRQPVLLLLLRSVSDDIIGDDVAVQGDPGGRADIGQLLVDHRIVAEVEAEPAIFLGNGRAEQAGLARFGPEVAIDDPFFLPAVDMGDQLLVEEAPDAVAELLMLGPEGGSAGCVEHESFLWHARGSGWRCGETGGGRGLGHSAGLGEGRAGGDVRMGGRVGERQDRSEAGVAAFEQSAPMVARLAQEQVRQLLAKARIVLAASRPIFSFSTAKNCGSSAPTATWRPSAHS